MAGENEIVFEDLHGVNEDKPVTVDLDAGSKDDGISETPAGDVAGADDGNDDDIQLDSLRSADADDEGGDEDDAIKPGEDDAYSKKVKARIARATRAEKKAKKDVANLDAEAKYWKEQAEKLAKGQYETQKNQLTRSVEQADSAIEQTQADLEKAIEGGDTKDQVRLTTKLTDLKAEKVRAEVSLEDLSPDGNVQPFSGKVPPASDEVATKADSWKTDQQDWYGARGFERQTRLANRLDREVYEDGYDPATDEYFEELDRRIKLKEPDLYDDTGDDADDVVDDDERKGGRKRAKPVVAPVSGNEARRQRTSGSKVDLGEADFANMRRFGLDPNDPEVLKEYARNKKEADQGANR